MPSNDLRCPVQAQGPTVILLSPVTAERPDLERSGSRSTAARHKNRTPGSLPAPDDAEANPVTGLQSRRAAGASAATSAASI